MRRTPQSFLSSRKPPRNVTLAPWFGMEITETKCFENESSRTRKESKMKLSYRQLSISYILVRVTRQWPRGRAWFLIVAGLLISTSNDNRVSSMRLVFDRSILDVHSHGVVYKSWLHSCPIIQLKKVLETPDGVRNTQRTWNVYWKLDRGISFPLLDWFQAVIFSFVGCEFTGESSCP